ncbi:MAG: phosphodiester glycosidase family protein, partial [Clostridia bacterium]|nr:phosphodiester glycosidase family protein [Clostridia bacterium]
MKKTSKLKTLTFILALIFIFSTLAVNVSAIDLWDMPALGDSSETQLVEGVNFTKFDLTGGKFGLQKVNVLEVDLKNRNLSLEVVYGKYLTSKMTMQNYVITYNMKHENEGKKMIAAVNGALWMTGVHCKVGIVASKVVTLPRGVVMHEGEILCSNETNEEGAAGNGGGAFAAFAVTDDQVPVIGVPMVDISLKNVTKNTTVVPNGLNRLPVNNTLMVYNGKLDTSNYALEDAYEVIVTYGSGEYVNGGVIKGTVRAVGKKGGETPLDANTIILSARGDHIPLINGYSVGDEIELSLSIHDTFRNQDDLWKRVKECMPGHMFTVVDGEENGLPDNSNYPCTMVGYKSDGTVVFIQNDGRQYIDWSNGLRIADMPAFCKMLGINTMINLDGGGSSTMVCGEDVVNRSSDGSPRAVINGIGIVSGPDRGEQGDVPIIEKKPFDPINVEFSDEAMTSRIGNGSINDASVVYSAEENAAKLYSASDTNDAYLGF